MRAARIKIPPEQGDAVYHCMTRVVNGERLIDDAAKEVLRKQMWLTAEFCGVQILTYAILSNHFHVLVRVPMKTPVPDAELLRRYQLLHPAPARFQTARLDVIKGSLADNTSEGQAWRTRQQILMGDVSIFMKLLKQRFSIWFNKNHNRFGTLFAERFKSVLVEPGRNALRTTALYIDLNPVRAGLVTDPKDYRFCGYGEAVAGNKHARDGLIRIHCGNTTWARTHDDYRIGLFGKGAAPKTNARSITPKDFERVLAQKGRLPLATVLRCRIRYFSDAAVLGSKKFVAKYLRLRSTRRQTEAKPLAPVTNWGGLMVLRALRRSPFG